MCKKYSLHLFPNQLVLAVQFLKWDQFLTVITMLIFAPVKT